MDKERIEKMLKKYGLSHVRIKELLEHLTFLEEHVTGKIPKYFGDRLDLNMSMTYTFDDQDYEASFDTDFSGNARSWTWNIEPETEFETEEDPHYIFLDSVASFLEDYY